MEKHRHVNKLILVQASMDSKHIELLAHLMLRLAEREHLIDF